MTHHFKDIDLTFNAHPTTGDVSVRSGTRAVMQSLREIILTTAGDWDYGESRRMGVGISDMLGENVGPLDSINIKDAIEEQVGIYEPRVELENVVVGSTVSQPNTLRIQISFYIINQPDVQTMEIPLVRIR